ncbi:hypothetical protein [Dysgonomonas sp. 511]|uniref:hypothetical protein n=1 Tax=Dysgonomonas sp. 511 TaxID=2302930 RepID=UPI0013D0F1C9|nr:hypothetical protein [Dysgonomonas sp. 511]NDV77906.1 hypothetical protein [Dysgonomonas sp. 511]
MDNKRTIAIITDKGSPCKEIKENTLVNVFRMEGDKVLGYESIKLENSNSFPKLLELKEISLIYIETLSKDMMRILQRLGINVKCKDEWSGDDFIGKFVFG